jgi:O-antigen ligase
LGDVVLAIPHRVALGPLSLAVFALVAVAALALTRLRPPLGIALLLACEPFDWAHDLGPTQITLGKVALAGVIAGLAQRRTSLRSLGGASTAPLVGGAIAIALVTALTAIPATYIDATARETLKALEYLLVFAAAAVAVRDEADEGVALRALGTLALAVCVLAIVQLGHASTSGILVAGRTIPRIAGPLEGPNQLAGYLDLIAIVFLARAIVARDPFARAVAIVAILTELLTLSRGGVGGLVVGALIVFGLRGGARISSRLLAGIGAGCVAVAIVAAKFGVASRFISADDVRRENGLGTRAELWSAALTLWRKDPALGIGAGNYELQLPSAGLIGVRTHANSLYLQSLAEGGIALASAVVWTLISAIALSLRDARRSVFLLGFGAATCAFAVHQIVDDVLFFPKVGTLWWALAGLAVARIYALRDAPAA